MDPLTRLRRADDSSSPAPALSLSWEKAFAQSGLPMSIALTPAEILGPTGRIAERLDRYERRPQQLEMAEAVAAAIAERRHLIVEAGTGVGKSFAYLVPAICAVTEPETEGGAKPPRTVVISTHTISLQEQLLNKDLPLLNSVIPREFTATLVKGRSNYLSRRRLANAQQRAVTLFADQHEFRQLRELAAWAEESYDGSLSDLSYRPLPQVWDEVASDSGNCMSTRCPRHGECFYYRARRRMRNSQVLIVNHALLLSDLALRRAGASILPDYQVVVFDEAHNLESVAGSHLGVRVTSGQVDYTLNKLYNEQKNKGLLVHHDLREAQRQVSRCRLEADDLFGAVHHWMARRGGRNGRVTEPKIVDNRLSPALVELSQLVKKHANRLHDETQRQDLTSASDRLKAVAGEIELWRKQQMEGSVYWIEASTGRRGQLRTTLAAAPIDVGPALRSSLFDVVPTVVMTSATLAVGGDGSFDFFKSRIGLTAADGLRLGSTFDYRRQVKLVTVPDMPDPTGEKQAFEKACVGMIRRYLQETDGHAFVLFTSYEMLRRAERDLTAWLSRQNMRLISQDSGMPRSRMVELFKQHPRSVLLGTDSFWQGVDVPGDALQNVIITKLPFSVPDQPLLQARLEAIRDSGGNPFHDYQLPEAVLKLRQGFGRLIRSRHDRGLVVILDPRVSSKPYGKTFLNSLPECEHRVDRYSV